MATTMLGLLGVFLFIFTTNTQLQVSADFNISKVEGKWYQTGVATNAKWFTDSKWMKKVSVAILTPTANGDVNMNGSVILTENSKDTSCLRFNLFLKKTKTTGKFILYNTRFQTRNDLYVLDVKYDEYIIVQNRWNIKEGVVFINKLLTRTPVVNPLIKQKFMQISKSNKNTAEKIVILPMKGECV
ncbi:lipocalin-like [Hemibagrus wyckioides]|nr:lipocalin-like [Hemibagrus wyckioides]